MQTEYLPLSVSKTDDVLPQQVLSPGLSAYILYSEDGPFVGFMPPKKRMDSRLLKPTIDAYSTLYLRCHVRDATQHEIEHRNRNQVRLY